MVYANDHGQMLEYNEKICELYVKIQRLLTCKAFKGAQASSKGRKSTGMSPTLVEHRHGSMESDLP